VGTTTKIQWTDQVWNPVVGCTPVSPGCLNCYAARMARRLEAMGRPEYAVNAGLAIATLRDGRPVFTGDVRTVPDRLAEPLGWRKPRRVFVNSMSDLFHEAVPFDFIDRVFAVMALCPRHAFQVLTKRPKRMAEYLACGGARRNIHVYNAAVDITGSDFSKFPGDMASTRSSGGTWWPLPNVWLGASVENQTTANDRIPHLLRCPAAVRFLSVEPLLGEVDLTRIDLGNDTGDCLNHRATDIWTGDGSGLRNWGAVHWVIVGGEGGPGARPCDVAWARSIVAQCRAAQVPVFVKQLGANIWATGPGEPGPWWTRVRDPKGGDPAEWPKDLRVRQFPETPAVPATPKPARRGAGLAPVLAAVLALLWAGAGAVMADPAPVAWPGSGFWPKPSADYRTHTLEPVQPGHLYYHQSAKALSDGARLWFWVDAGVGVAGHDSSTGPSWFWNIPLVFQIDDTLALRPKVFVGGAMMQLHFPGPNGTREWQVLYTAGGDNVYGYPNGPNLVFFFPDVVVPPPAAAPPPASQPAEAAPVRLIRTFAIGGLSAACAAAMVLHRSKPAK
jgi:protein gp37